MRKAGRGRAVEPPIALTRSHRPLYLEYLDEKHFLLCPYISHTSLIFQTLLDPNFYIRLSNDRYGEPAHFVYVALIPFFRDS